MKMAQQRREKDVGTPLSPAVASRTNEKNQLVNLNNRMAVYVEKVRSLENENSRLTFQVTSYEETSKREITKVKEIYDRELNGLRKSYDAACSEKANLELENQSLRERAELADALTVEKDKLDQKCKDLSKQLRQRDSMYNEANRERNEAVKEMKKLQAQLAERIEELNTNVRLLQEESLKVIDAQNLNSTLREQLQFKENLYNQQLTDATRRHEYRVTEIDEQVKSTFESKLEQTIMDLREQQNAEFEQYKDDLQAQFSGKIEGLRKQLDFASTDRLKSDEERRIALSRVKKFEATISSLQLEINTNLKRIGDLESRLEHEQQSKRAAILAAEQERDAARIKLDEMEKDYAELQNIKLQLDMEISTYRALLEEEEHRLNISPTPQGTKTRSRAGKKRKRVAQKEATTEGQSAKKQQREVTVTTATYTSETSSRQGSASAEHYTSGNEDENKSCAIM